MDVVGEVAVVTGGASGIGLALAHRFAVEGARAVVVVDLDPARAAAVAAELAGSGHLGLAVDVADPVAVAAMVDRVETQVGPIGLWCSNAGVATGRDLAADEDWTRAWDVHVMAHVYAARHVLPRMLARDRGHFMITASAAGLLTEMDLAPYAVTKHGSVALAEWLAIRYGGAGVGFSCLCPQAVATPMLATAPPESATTAAGAVLEPERVADAVMAALASSQFLILPHPEVADYARRRSADPDRWIRGMRRLWASLHPES
ncbi:MAG: SDR family NAD(P)-dependent oxidoreductase [Sporichthyaceae bacterium]|nr:SDR family NAD(P)-dependent oxidoreductase [Sporichthyaceae bacterium]